MPLIVSLRERVAIHEGFHTASLLMDHLAPLLTRIDTWERQAGLTKMDWANHDPTSVVLRKTLVAIALGPIADGQHEVHEWPIDPHDWHENQT